MRIYEFNSNYVGPIVYHGSKTADLGTIEPKPSHLANEDVVFGATLFDVAVAMAGHWTDDDLEFGREGQEHRGKMISYRMKELRPGAIDEFFKSPTLVYLLPSEGFTQMEGLQDFELANPNPVEPISYIVIDNPLDFLRNSPIVVVERYKE